MGARHDGFCDPLATDTARTGCGRVIVDLHIGEILPVVHLRENPATWSTSIYSVG